MCMESVANSCKRHYESLLNRILPPELDRLSEEADDIARLVILALLAVLVIPCFVIEFIYFGLWNLVISLMLAGVFMVGAPWIYKWTRNLTIARELFLCSLFGFKLWESLFFAGIISPGSIWFIAMPIGGILLGSVRSGICWLAIVITSFIGLYAIFDNNVVFANSAIVASEFIYTFSLTFMVLAVVSFVLMVDAARKKAFRRLEEANNKVRELAIRDPLTGIYNRRHVWEAMEREERRAAAEFSTFFIFLIDLDNFKAINDKLGHATGDRVLQDVAKAIEGQVREEDCFGRYGGEEFILLLRSGNALNPDAFAERIRCSVSSLRFGDIHGLDAVTVSIGIAQFHRGESFSKTISRADTALYAAKAAGRDRVIRANEPEAAAC